MTNEHDPGPISVALSECQSESGIKDKAPITWSLMAGVMGMAERCIALTFKSQHKRLSELEQRIEQMESRSTK